MPVVVVKRKLRSMAFGRNLNHLLQPTPWNYALPVIWKGEARSRSYVLGEIEGDTPGSPLMLPLSIRHQMVLAHGELIQAM
jgi:hypothetical protein